MKRNTVLKIIIAGILGGFVGNAVLGVVFTSPPVRSILYDPGIQSQTFIDITPLRNVPLSVTGLVVLSVIHAWLFFVFRPSMPGKTWVEKGIFWGFVIWSMFWLFQEWFVYHTLLGEPLILNALELSVLLLGSSVEGIIIAFFLERKK